MSNEQVLRNAQRNETDEEIMNQELTHREKAFSDAMIEIKKMAATAAEEAIDAVYMKYLPHVEDDTESNARTIANAIVRNIIAGDITVQSDSNWFSVRDNHGSKHFFNIDRPSVLDALVSAMGEEIKSARIRQLEVQLACLREDFMR